MSENSLQDSPRGAPGAKMRARDSRGRWVRNTVVAKVEPDQDFIFDDRALEKPAPAADEQFSLRLDDTEGAPERGPGAVADSPPLVLEPPEAGVDDLPPTIVFQHETEPRSRGNLVTWFWALGAALLLGVGLFAVQRGFFATKRAAVTASVPVAPSATPVVAPPAAKQTLRRPAASAGVAPARVKDREAAAVKAPSAVPPAVKQTLHRPVAAGVVAPPPRQEEVVAVKAPVASPPAPEPKVPTPVASAPVSLPTPAHPDPPPVVAGESVPAPAAVQTIPDEEGWFSLAEEYLQMGDENRAEELYRRIVKEGVQQGRAALALGDLFARKNDFDRAQEFYRLSKQFFQGKIQPASSP